MWRSWFFKLDNCKIYFVDGGNSPWQYNPYETGNIRYSGAVLNQDSDARLTNESTNLDLKWDSWGSYLENLVPTSGVFGLEFYVFGSCSSCCSYQEGNGRPLFHTISTSLNQSNSKYVMTLKYLKCMPCF